MGVSVKKVFTLLLSTLVVAGCAQSTEFGEVSSAIRDSQDMQGEVETPKGPSDSDEGQPVDSQLLERLLALEWPMNGDDCSPGPWVVGLSGDRFVVLSCDVEQKWRPEANASSVVLDELTGFPLEAVEELKDILAQQEKGEGDEGVSAKTDDSGIGSAESSTTFRISDRLVKEGRACEDLEEQTIGVLFDGTHGWLTCDSEMKWVAFGGDLFEDW